ncbi:hypothetical protein H0E87_018336 [Populus deltoides]|uniref:60S ribosome subunit biogenesis protein NIP7 homolog n=1 Tax=Populus deltoides TaxID=3696 RepID=A0A8T2XSF2_POPDE|nr:hypothetical protein H0E87_018336 [Populus deltoides]
MRPLDEKEMGEVFKKLMLFTGNNLKNIIESPSHEGPDPNPGTCIGKFTHRGDFRLTTQSLNLLAANAKNKVWLKPTSEMSFLYGNHVLKGGLGKITDSINQNDGVVVFSMSDVPLGFGTAARSTQDCRKCDPNGIVVHHYSDIGEYLRDEDDL